MNIMNLYKREDELLAATDKKYNAKCLIGNWPGEKLQQDVSLIGKLPF